jgi:hypothetical protein
VISVKVDGKDFYLIGKGTVKHILPKEKSLIMTEKLVIKLPSGLIKELHENYKEIMELIG